MPLKSGKSESVFKENLETELAHGKPKEQALAIAYAKQRGDSTHESIMDDVNKAIDLAGKIKHGC